jgi:sulfur carrier protein ThiS
MDDLTPYVAEPEIVDREPAGHVRVLALKNPFNPMASRVDQQMPEGSTLGDIIRSLGLADQHPLVSIDGSPVPLEWWDRVRPRAGHVVVVRAIPRGGGGGGGNKGWIQIIAGVILIIVGIVLAVGTWGAATPFGIPLIIMGIGLVAGGAIALLMPPPSLPKLKSGSGGDSPVFSITGSRNTANPYGAVPKVYGRHRIFPPTEAS